MNPYPYNSYHFFEGLQHPLPNVLDLVTLGDDGNVFCDTLQRGMNNRDVSSITNVTRAVLIVYKWGFTRFLRVSINTDPYFHVEHLRFFFPPAVAGQNRLPGVDIDRVGGNLWIRPTKCFR